MFNIFHRHIIINFFIIIFYLGLDFALLQKVRSEIIHRENAGDEEEYEEEIKGGLISEDCRSKLELVQKLWHKT